MIKYTDYVIQVEVDSEALDNLDYVIVSLKQNNNRIDKTIHKEEISENIMAVSFSQKETAGFLVGNAELQVNAFYQNERHASNIVSIRVTKNLLGEVINE